MRAEGEIAAKGLLAAVGEACRRWNVGGSDLGKRLREKYKVVCFEEVVDHGRPDGNAMAEEGMAVFAEGWSAEELVLSAGGTEGSVELLGDLWPEVFVVVGVDPEHRRARMPAEVAISVDQSFGVAYLMVGV